MSISYAYEKFIVAVDTLATGRGRIQERLENAFVGALVRIAPDDLPEPFRGRFIAIDSEVTSVKPVDNEGAFKASIGKLSEDRCTQIAHEIVELFNELGHIDPINALIRSND